MNKNYKDYFNKSIILWKMRNRLNYGFVKTVVEILNTTRKKELKVSFQEAGYVYSGKRKNNVIVVEIRKKEVAK